MTDETAYCITRSARAASHMNALPWPRRPTAVALSADVEVEFWRQRMTPLQWTAECSAECSAERSADSALSKVAQVLVAAGASLDTEENGIGTPLFWAAYNGRTEVAEVLVRAGANLNAKDSKGQTPLQMAAKFGFAQVARLLIQARADVNAKDEEGVTPLHVVASEDVAQLLVDARADVNAKDTTKTGRRPLHLAASCGRVGVAQVLVAAMADINIKDNEVDSSACTETRTSVI